MALTIRANGSNPDNLIGASWFNDYYDLVTGAMTDQPVTLDYAPGSAGATPTLTLKTNGNGDLLQGYNGASKVFVLAKDGSLADGSNDFYALLVGTGATAGRRIFVGPTTPSGAQEGDLWVKA